MASAIAHHRVATRRNTSVFTHILNAIAVWRQRRHLALLDAHLRADIGLNDRSILAESSRPVWDVPQNWRV